MTTSKVTLFGNVRDVSLLGTPLDDRFRSERKVSAMRCNKRPITTLSFSSFRQSLEYERLRSLIGLLKSLTVIFFKIVNAKTGA